MAYNLRSRLISEGSSVAPRSEVGMNLSPVELAVPMSEQTPTTAGYGLDLLGPVVIEGSPEALQTVAMPAPFTSQIVSDTSVADVETDELTETLNTTIVPTPAMHLAPPPVTSIDPSYTDHSSFTDPASFRDPSLARRHSAAHVVVRCLAGWMSVTFGYCVETAKDTAMVAAKCKQETVPMLLDGRLSF